MPLHVCFLLKVPTSTATRELTKRVLVSVCVVFFLTHNTTHDHYRPTPTQDLSNAIGLNAHDPDTFQQRGQLYHRLKDYTQGNTWWQHRIQKQPQILTCTVSLNPVFFCRVERSPTGVGVGGSKKYREKKVGHHIAKQGKQGEGEPGAGGTRQQGNGVVVEFLWFDIERHGLQPRSHSMLPRRYVPCCVQCVSCVQCIVCAHCVYFMCLMYPVCEPMQPICSMRVSNTSHKRYAQWMHPL